MRDEPRFSTGSADLPLSSRARSVLTWGALALLVPATGWAQSRPTTPLPEAMAERLGPAAPEADEIDRADLTRLVRQALHRKISNGKQDEVTFVPHSLKEVSCRASVSLRQQGRLLGTADSETRPVVEAVLQAAHAALATALSKTPLLDADLDALGLEIELSGERQRVGHAGEPAGRLAQFFEPAIHGVAIRSDGREVLLRPSQLISMEIFCDDTGELGHRCVRYELALESFQEKLGLWRSPPDRNPASVLVYRFQTTHWYQRNAAAEPVLLLAGMRIIPPEVISPANLPGLVGELGSYLLYRQNRDGLFSYEFLPGRNVYWNEDQNWVRQAGTAWMLARYARHCGEPRFAEGSRRSIDALKELLRPVRNQPRAAYLHTPDRLHPLGAAALLSLAIIDSPDPDAEADLLAALMAGIESRQQPDGHFETHFPPSQKVSSQDYYPGEALLAIARYYRLHPDGQRRAIFDRALPYYTQYFRESLAVPFIPWQAQAWGEMARTTQLRKYADFAFELTDHLLTLQMTEPLLPLAIYDGAIDTSGEHRRGGVSTTVYLEGLVDAIRTADAFGEAERAERYRAAARRMARFVVQLCFREEEGYYVQSPREVYGGVRNTPIDPTLRIDHVQHALAALMGVAEVLGTASRPAGAE